MNILYLCADPGIPILGRKGASVHVRSLILACTRAGHSVVLVAPRLEGSPWEEPVQMEAPVLQLQLGDGAKYATQALKAFNRTLGIKNALPSELRRILYNQELEIKLKRRFEKRPPDFIYERASLYSTAGVALAREFNVPLLVELNAPLALEQSTYRDTGFGDLAAQAEKWTLMRSDAVLAVSDPLRDYVIAMGVESSKVHVFPNGVDTSLFKPAPSDPAIRARWNLDDGPVLGFVGGLRPWHGVMALPTLLERLIPRAQNLRLLIVGDGPLRSELERDVQKRGLSQNVVFTGNLPHHLIAELICQFDVALAPYAPFEHPFYFSPLKIFEYMACAVPVVATRLGQISQVIRDGETGLLYPPGDLEAMTVACNRLLTDAALRQRLGQTAAQAIRDRYTWDHNAARMVELARVLIDARQEN